MAPKSGKKAESVPPAAPVEEQSAALAVSDSSSALATSETDEWDYGEDANKGFRINRDEYSIPFYGLLQSNSEVVKQEKIAGARGGDFLNSMTGELFKTLIIQPVHIDRTFVEWAPRNSGKGICGRHKPDSAEVQDAIARNEGSSISTKDKPLKLGDNFLVDTRYVYFNRLADDGVTPIGFGIMPFSKTKIKALVNATSAIHQAGLKSPPWGGRFVMTSKIETKNGETFHNIDIKAFGKPTLHFDKTNLLPPRHPLYQDGKRLEAQVTGGEKVADFSAEDKFGGDTESEESKQARHF